MSQDVITVGSTMRILLLYRGEYSQWREWLMNYLEEQTDGEAMINSIQTGDHPLHVVTHLSLVGTTSNVPPLLKDKSMWMLKRKRIKRLIDALKRHMLGSEYGEQDRKAAVLYEYETFKATEGEMLLDTYIRYLQVINDLKKCGNKKDNSFSLANKKPEYVKSEEKKEDKKSDEKKWGMSNVKCYNCKKEGHFTKYCKKTKVKDYNYYKTKMLLAKKDNDEQVLLAEEQAWMESSGDSDQEINANMVFMAKTEKVLSDSEESSSSAEETIVEVSYYTSDSKSESEYETSEYYDNSTNYDLFVNNDDDQEIFHDAIEFASENSNENHIVSQTDHDQLEVDHNDSEEKDHLVKKLIKKFDVIFLY
nr:hypothetical protein [Tanacetum cinerariifolium]